jgi:short-subunit dehydrogenase
VLEGKTVLVTGASAGIGAAVARELAVHGANLVLAARRRDRLDALAAELSGRVKVHVVTADVTRDGDLERVVAEAEAAFGRLDVAVANAGFAVTGPFARLGLPDFRRQFETNVFGVLRTAYAALPALERAKGQLVLMGSVSGHVAGDRLAPYSMSKFAVRALAESIHDELAARDIAVTLLSPGFIVSDIGRVDNDGAWHEEDRSRAPRWLRVDTAAAAREIVAAIETRPREAVITTHGRLVVFLGRHAPWLLRALFRAFAPRGARATSNSS